jgi:aminobenzoyl-glutamate transport protein
MPKDRSLSPEPTRGRGWLDRVEWLGDRLPEPAMLFVWCLGIVAAVSLVGAWAGWRVQPVKPVLVEAGGARVRLVDDGAAVTCQNLVSSDGVFWLLRTMVRNFIEFPPLGVVLVCMLGVGVAERTGLIGTALRAAMRVIPARLLTPAIVFLGINGSMAADAGIIVLPPLAAALYRSVGRSPLAGIATVFAATSAGFSANLFITSLDPLLGVLTQTGARVIDPAYEVNPACNWWFMMASTVLLTFVGWAVSSLVVEPRLARRSADDGGPDASAIGSGAAELSTKERRGLLWAVVAVAAGVALVVACTQFDGWPLSTRPGEGARWVAVVVPIIFGLFLLPGVVYGRTTGTLKRLSDTTKLMAESVASLAPMLVLAFVAAQFIAAFKYTNLDRMLAFGVGKELAAADLPPALLLVAIVMFSIAFDLLVSSASAKWSLLAPIFVPMMMLLGLSPAVTQAAFRVGDSVANPVLPLNAYLVIVLLVMRQYAPRAKLGTLMGMTLPFSLAFGVVWTSLLLVWFEAGWALGPGGAVGYVPGK